MTVVELSLFDPPAPMVRAADPVTSQLAAKRVNPQSGQRKVLAALLRIGRGTDADIRVAPECAGMGMGSASKRRKECVEAGWVEFAGFAGEKRPRMLWRLTDAGRIEASR